MFAQRFIDRIQDLSDFKGPVADQGAVVWDETSGKFATQTTWKGATRVAYASRNGCACDADLSDPTVGTDDSAALQALVDAVASSPGDRTIVIDGPMKVGNVKLPTGITIVGSGGSSFGSTFPDTGIIQAPNTVCVFRNKNWVSRYNGGSPVSDWSLVEDENITIANLFINGNRGNGGVHNAAGGNGSINTINGADEIANPSRLGITPLLFFGVRGLTVNDVWVYDPGTLAILVAYAEFFEIDGVTVLCPSVYNNLSTPTNISITGNGMITVAAMCRFGKVRNVVSYNTLVAVDIVADYGVTFYAGNLLPAYYPIVYPGTLLNIDVENLYAVGPFPVRIWSGNGTAGNLSTFSSLIDDVSIRHVRGLFIQQPWDIDGPSPVLGTHGVQTWTDVNMTALQGQYSFSAGGIEGNHDRLIFKDLVLNISGITSWTNAALGKPSVMFLNIGNGGLGVIKIDGLTVYDMGANNYDLIQNAATTPYLRINNVLHKRTQMASGALVHAGNNTSITELKFSDVTIDGVSNLLLLDSGAINTVCVTGLSHRNANGGASVQVNGAGVTVSRLRAAGSDTALLSATSGGGAITSKKTDGTEDA